MTLKEAKNFIKNGWKQYNTESDDNKIKEYYILQNEASNIVNTHSFNGKKLEVGDKVIVIFGYNFRHSIIESIPTTGEAIYRGLKIKGLKKKIRSSNIIKL